uniref:Uncharacterized protein n=1 Tax=Oryza meridionalis TaxID=40149 RepID=A0A0E0DVW8_9ORYZ
MESAMAWTIRVKTASCAVGGGDDDMASAGTESNVEMPPLPRRSCSRASTAPPTRILHPHPASTASLPGAHIPSSFSPRPATTCIACSAPTSHTPPHALVPLPSCASVPPCFLSCRQQQQAVPWDRLVSQSSQVHDKSSALSTRKEQRHVGEARNGWCTAREKHMQWQGQETSVWLGL